MADHWLREETTTHQDHVIAHVLGATLLGYFIKEEAAHLVLDMGFIWTIYLDGQMVLLPQSVALKDLTGAPEFVAQVKRDIEQLESEGRAAKSMQQITSAPAECLIMDAEFFACDERRRLRLIGEEASFVIETSLSTREIRISADY